MLIFLCLLPLIYFGLTALFLHSQWDHIVTRIPVHYDFRFHPDAWARKNFFGVFRFLIIGLIVQAINMIMFFVFLSLPSKYTEPLENFRFERARMRNLFFLLGVMHWFALVFCHISIVITLAPEAMPGALLLEGVAAILVILVLLPLYYLFRPKLPPLLAGRKDVQISDPHWKLETFYWNKDNPKLIIERKYGYGFTVNLARPAVWGLAALIAFLIMGPMIVIFILLAILGSGRG